MHYLHLPAVYAAYSLVCSAPCRFIPCFLTAVLELHMVCSVQPQDHVFYVDDCSCGFSTLYMVCEDGDVTHICWSLHVTMPSCSDVWWAVCCLLVHIGVCQGFVSSYAVSLLLQFQALIYSLNGRMHTQFSVWMAIHTTEGVQPLHMTSLRSIVSPFSLV